MSHLINHYIENKNLIPTILDFGWTVQKNTWTNCPLNIQREIQIWYDLAHSDDPRNGD
jgi:hypothetical protein